LSVTASIVGLTTSRDEKSSPALLDMVAKKTVLSVFCCVAGSKYSHRQCEEGSANGVLAFLVKNTDIVLLLIFKAPATAVLTYFGSSTSAFRRSVEYHELGFPPNSQFSTTKAAESRRLSWNIPRASYIMSLLPEASHIVHITLDTTVSSSPSNSHTDHSPTWRFLTSPRSLYSRSRLPLSTMAWRRLLRWDGYTLSHEPKLPGSS
jgi:hypothetical protein